jgi:hypothetical protein
MPYVMGLSGYRSRNSGLLTEREGFCDAITTPYYGPAGAFAGPQRTLG